MDRRRLVAATSILLLPLLLWGLSRLTTDGGGAPPPPSVTRPEVHAVAAPPVDLPQDVAQLLREERYWRAARLLRQRVGEGADPELVVVAAKAEAGWGGWSNARALLEGKPWLDRAAGGDGWYVLGRAREEAGQWPAAADAYARYLRAAPDTGRDGERAVGQLRHGLALLRAGRVDEGVRALERLREAAPSVHGWASVLAAEAVAPRGDTARVRALASSAMEAAPLRAQRARLRAYRAANDLAGARALATAFRAAAAEPAARAELDTEAGRAALALGDTAGGRQALRAAVAGAPASAAAVEAARLLSTLPGLTAADQLAIGTVYERHGNASRAAAGLRAWLAANLGTPAERADVRLRLGRALFNAGDHAEAEAALRPLAADPGLGGEALYWTGRAQYRRGSRAAAIETLVSAGRFRTAGAADALYLAADLTQDAGNGARARALYRRVADEHPGSPKAGLALMRLGGMSFSAGDHAGAARLYDEYRGRYPQGDQWLQASYWAGRAHATRGDASAARERWRGVREREPASYYAVLSAKRLREPFWPVKVEAAPGDDPRALERVSGWLRGIDLLRAAGLHDEATAEAERRVRGAGDDRALLYPLAEALGERGLPAQAIALGRRLQRGPGVYDARLLRILNPFPYRALIAAEARERGLDPFLVAALIRQESSFRPRVVSRAGAMGLMQVMPATGAGLASAAGIRGWERDLLLNPEINVHLGTRFLAAQMRAYDGSLPSVFSAYNAGPGRVRQWRRFPEYRDPELFTERIPFDETRDYVKILTRNIELYRGLYGG